MKETKEASVRREEKFNYKAFLLFDNSTEKSECALQIGVCLISNVEFVKQNRLVWKLEFVPEIRFFFLVFKIGVCFA